MKSVRQPTASVAAGVGITKRALGLALAGALIFAALAPGAERVEKAHDPGDNAGAIDPSPQVYAHPSATQNAARTRLEAGAGPLRGPARPAPQRPRRQRWAPSAVTHGLAALGAHTSRPRAAFHPTPPWARAQTALSKVSIAQSSSRTMPEQFLITRPLPHSWAPPTPGSFHEIGFDPKVIYDRNASRPRFYVAGLTTDDTSKSSLYLAISRSPDPSTLTSADWCRYVFPGVSDAGTSNAASADYPEIGVGPNGVIITTNQYRFSDSDFTFARVRILQKLTANNNSASCPSPASFNLGTWRLTSANNDWTRITVVPSLAYTTASSFSGAQSQSIWSPRRSPTRRQTPGMPVSASYYRVWRVSNIGSGNPRFNSTNVFGNFSSQSPPPGVQAGGEYYTHTADTRGMATVSLGNRLYYVHQTQCQVGGGYPESCLRIMRFNVGQSSNGSFAASISQQLTSGIAGYYFVPSQHSREQRWSNGANHPSGELDHQLGIVVGDKERLRRVLVFQLPEYRDMRERPRVRREQGSGTGRRLHRCSDGTVLSEHVLGRSRVSELFWLQWLPLAPALHT